MRFFLGTYTENLGHVKGAGPGIIPCELDPATGEVRQIGSPLATRNPAYLWLNRAGDRLYAANEIYDFAGKTDGSISVIAVDRETAALTRIQEASSHGAGPAYVRGCRSERHLLVANYMEGSITVLPFGSDGRFNGATVAIPHTGSGPNPTRQEAPHPHAIMATPDNEYIHVADLGTDRLEAYQFDDAAGRLAAAPEASFAFPPGSGPRHFLFAPDGQTILVDLELSSEVAVLRRNQNGTSTLRCEQIISTRHAGATGVNHPSEIALSTDARHVYVANRGDDTIAVFELDPAPTPKLTPRGHIPCGGRTPRHIALSPDGRFLLVANQDSDTVTILSRDPATGTLSATGQSFPIGTPCFVLFV